MLLAVDMAEGEAEGADKVMAGWGCHTSCVMGGQ